MTTLTRFLFQQVDAPPSFWSVINWWESRRAVYNLSLGVVGVISLSAVALVAHLPPRPVPFTIPWVAVALYAVSANLCYTIGPALDLAIRRRWGNQYAAIGPTLFRYGFVFALGLTFLPVPLVILGWLLRAIGLAG